MEIISDVLLAAAAIGAGIYCAVLGRRLSNLQSTEGGIGEAVSLLSKQMTQLEAQLTTAQDRAENSSSALRQLTEDAETVAKRLELLVASMHELPSQQEPEPQKTPEVTFLSQRHTG